MKLELNKSGCDSWYHYLKVVWSWIRPLTSLCFCYFFCLIVVRAIPQWVAVRFGWNNPREELLEIAQVQFLQRILWLWSLFLPSTNSELYLPHIARYFSTYPVWRLFLTVLFLNWLPNRINFISALEAGLPKDTTASNSSWHRAVIHNILNPLARTLWWRLGIWFRW